MAERLVFEIADRELDLRVIVVIDICRDGRDGAVGRAAVMTPVGKQFALGSHESGAAHNQPESPIVVSAICACPRRTDLPGSADGRSPKISVIPSKQRS